MYVPSQQYTEGHSPEPDVSNAKRETRDSWIQKRSRGKSYFRAISHFGDCMKLWERSRAGLRAMVLSSTCHFGGSESFTTMLCYLTLR